MFVVFAAFGFGRLMYAAVCIAGRRLCLHKLHKIRIIQGMSRLAMLNESLAITIHNVARSCVNLVI